MGIRINRNDISNFVHKHLLIFQNLSYVTILQIFMLVAPLITFPYVTKVLGQSLYGVVLTAQMLASYASLIIDFGSNNVCAKHVAQNRNDIDKLSEIFSSVFWVRLLLCILCLFIYIVIVFLIPEYREYKLLFFLSYAMTTQELLFPQYFFLPNLL